MRVLAFLLGAAALFAGSAAVARPLVAVIDSGVAMTRELQPHLVAEYDMAVAQARPAFHPDHDHGTMVATILSRAAKGAVDIVSLRIDDPAGCAPGLSPPCQDDPEPVAAAIRKATSLGVTAINLSLNVQDDASIRAAIHDAARKHILVILAAGNDGQDHPGNLGLAQAGSGWSMLVGALDGAGNPWMGTNRPDGEAGHSYEYVWQPGVAVPTMSAASVAVHATGTSFAAPIETARRVLALGAPQAGVAETSLR
jgi:hypothetical protein